MAKANRKTDYAFKGYVLRNYSDLISNYKKAKLHDYAVSMYLNEGIVLNSLNSDSVSLAELQNECIYNELGNVYNEIAKIENASCHRATRLRSRIEKMLLNGECLFLTLTFNDETLNNTSADTRRQYVRKYLKRFKCSYVANIDFGKENGREHYHAVINTSRIELKDWRIYGNINVERVRNNRIELSKTRLSKYISKLSNHAIKETTKRSCLIYSRD